MGGEMGTLAEMRDVVDARTVPSLPWSSLALSEYTASHVKPVWRDKVPLPIG